MKNGFIIALGAVVLAVICLLCVYVKNKHEGLAFSFEIETGNQSAIIDISNANEEWTVYLPSFADSENTYAKIYDNASVILDGKNIANHENLGWVTEGTHNLVINNEAYDIEVCQSANVAAAFVDLYRGNIEDLYTDKEKSTTVSVKLFDSNGKEDYYDAKATISGRGNATWNQEKKPFSLKFKNEVPLLGMDPENDWALLANALDRSGIRDALMKQFADYLGMDYTMDTRYVDLYIDGKYNGLYLLSEKPDVDEDYMGRIEYLFRIKKPIEFETESGIKMEKYPSSKGTEVYTVAEDTIASVRDYIYYDNPYNPLDMDSWAKAYLVDEILANIDAGRASSYLYWNEGGKVYKGPIWDGDMTIGSSSIFGTEVDCLTACEAGSCWRNLLKKEEFLTEVNGIYNENRDGIENFLIGKIDSLDAEICTARYMDQVRWGNMYSSQPHVIESPKYDAADLKQFVHDKLDYLDEALRNPVQYRFVVFMVGGLRYPFTVEKGTVFKIPDKIASLYESDVWVDSESGAKVDLSKPVEENIKVVNADSYNMEEDLTSRSMWKLHVVVLAAFAILLAGAIVIDKRTNR